MPKINQSERARLTWSVLSKVARKHETITYGQLGAAIGVHHRAIRYVLGPIQDYCIEEDLPPLTILVNNTAGIPGTGFIAHDRDDLGSGMNAVWLFDWRSRQNPFEFAVQGASFESLVVDLAASPDDAAEVYALVKTRGLRHLLFRSAVFKAYAWRCAFSGIEFVEALEAAHIVPWANSTPQQRMDVRNGLVLSSLHHKLFDKGLITINTDYEIKYFDPECVDREYSILERSLTVSLHGKRMQVPRLLKHRPLAENIAQHHELLGWEF
jgi:putative restriction endonuclease